MNRRSWEEFEDRVYLYLHNIKCERDTLGLTPPISHASSATSGTVAANAAAMWPDVARDADVGGAGPGAT